MLQYRQAVARPISSRSVIARRLFLPNQPVKLRSSTPHFPWQTRATARAFPGSVMVYRGPDQLEGFFDIFKKVGSAVVGAVKGVFRDSTVTLPGGVQVPAKDVPRVLTGSSITFGKSAPGPVEQLVDQVPGGFGTIATVAAVGLGVALLMGGRARR